MADSKSIRAWALAHFIEKLPEWQADKDVLRNRKFRRDQLADLLEQYSTMKPPLTIPAACTHYNHALSWHRYNDDPAIRAQVEGLGRPEDKKGGRKKKPVAAAQVLATATVVAPAVKSVVALQHIAGLVKSVLVGAPASAEAAVVAEVEKDLAVEYPHQEQRATFTVKKKRTGEVVATGLHLQDAEALVLGAKATKKGAMYWE